MLGFKTFARQTEIQFDGGVTAIVGPNGSGKTNIVDSIKWVLGSGQARDLRGKKMEEVIYAGGERRSRAGYAEVALVFDNTAGRLPVDYHEVEIKRRITTDVAAIVADPAFRARAESVGTAPRSGTPEEFAAAVEDQRARITAIHEATAKR